MQYVGPYSPEAYNAASILASGGAATPYNGAIIDAGRKINAAQPGASSGAGGAGGAGGNADEAGYWSDQAAALQNLLNNTNVQRQQGLAGIDRSYNNAVSRTNQDQSRVLGSYGTQRQDTLGDKQKALGRVDTQARTGYDTLQRLLGVSGAGVSSAAQEAVPFAVSRQASGQRADVFDTSGRNLRAIGLAEEDAKTQYQRALEDLLTQKQSKIQAFLGSVLGQQSDINSRIADTKVKQALAGGGGYAEARAARAPFQDAINAGLNSLNALFDQYKTPSFSVGPVTPKVAELSPYTVDPAAQRVQAQNTATDQSLVPYLPFLQRKEQGLVGLGV